MAVKNYKHLHDSNGKHPWRSDGTERSEMETLANSFDGELAGLVNRDRRGGVRIGDKEWVRSAAKIVRDTSRVIDREFARRVLKELRDQRQRRFGEPIDTAPQSKVN